MNKFIVGTKVKYHNRYTSFDKITGVVITDEEYTRLMLGRVSAGPGILVKPDLELNGFPAIMLSSRFLTIIKPRFNYNE